MYADLDRCSGGRRHRRRRKHRLWARYYQSATSTLPVVSEVNLHVPKLVEDGSWFRIGSKADIWF